MPRGSHARGPGESAFRHVQLPRSLGLRRLDPLARLAPHPLRPRRLVGVPRHPPGAGLFPHAAQGLALPHGLPALRRVHPELRDDAPDGSDHLLVASLPARGAHQGGHRARLLDHRARPGPRRAAGPGDAESGGAPARDRRPDQGGTRAAQGQPGARTACPGTHGGARHDQCHLARGEGAVPHHAREHRRRRHRDRHGRPGLVREPGGAGHDGLGGGGSPGQASPGRIHRHRREESRAGRPSRGPCDAAGTVVGPEDSLVLVSRSGVEYPIDESAAPIRDRGGMSPASCSSSGT